MASIVPDDAPRPRLCHVRKWEDFNGYGFNLHAEKGKAGQFIGKVDPGSPADFAGMKEGDRIVEINGTNISNENHQQVVQRVKAVPHETKMLVVDSETEDYYRNLKIVVRGDMPNVDSQSTPERNPGSQIADAVANNISDRISNDGDSDSRKSSLTPELKEEIEEKIEEKVEERVENVEQVLDALENVDVTDHPFRARLCHMKLWADFQGYGFNLHAEKNKTGQYIGKVDPGSPAEAAGLRESDRIIEANGRNVTGENHQAVVSIIKSVPNETRLLVLDGAADDYFREKGIVLTEDSPMVDRIMCPDSKPTVIEAVSAVQEAVEDTMSHPYKARFIQLVTWPDYNGYGFNMHSIKGKEGEFIGKIEPGSPAFVAGLKEGDRVIEVGGSNTESSSHHEVVEKIKAASGRATLLVVDNEADAYFISKSIKINSTMSAMSVITCPDSKPQVNGTSEGLASQDEPPAYSNGITDNDNTIAYDEEITRSQDSPPENAEDEQENYVDANDYEYVQPPSPITDSQNNNEDEKDDVIREPSPEPVFEASPEPAYEMSPSPEPEDEAQRPVVAAAVVSAAKESPKTPVVVGGIEFAGSAEEARKRMTGKKREVRATSSSMSAKQKYDMFQRL